MAKSVVAIPRLPLLLLLLQRLLISSGLAFFSSQSTHSATCSSFSFPGHQHHYQQKDHQLISSVPNKGLFSNSEINLHRKNIFKYFAMPMKDMQTSYEWLSKEKGCEIVSGIEWFDPYGKNTKTNVDSNICSDDNNNINKADLVGSVDTMPLYPLGACYLPTKTSTHVLNNVQPKNIRMALDLTNSNKYPKQNFCVTLCALDTNRVAKIGTVLHLKSIEKHYDSVDKTSLSRIVVTCQPIGLVEILNVSKSTAVLVEKEEEEFQRINVEEKDGGDSYLVATVRDYPPKEELCNWKQLDDNDNDGTLKRLWETYSIVRSMYVNDPKKRTAIRELPPFAVEAVQQSLLSEWMSFSSFDDNDEESNNNVKVHDDNRISHTNNKGNDKEEEEEFWKLAESWQTLCNTLRQGHLSNLYSDINEVMIAAARAAQGGPLKLPVKKENLPRQVQTQIKMMEQNANENFISLGMDPCLDFQALISLPSWTDRVDLLLSMVERERQRLVMKENLLDGLSAVVEEEIMYENKIDEGSSEKDVENDTGFQ